MTLFEYMQLNDNMDYDVWDTVYDDCVTVCLAEEESDNYDKFCFGIAKLVPFDNGGEYVIADWNGFIERNESVFREWSELYWRDGTIPDDEDDFIEDWIIELHGMFAGGMSEDQYKKFVEEFLSRLKS